MFEEELRKARKRPILDLTQAGPRVDLRGEALQTLLPHRDPFLLLDSVDRFDPELRAATGTRRIDPSDPVFAGHFPGAPVYPGVLQVEMMGQLGVCLNTLLHRRDRGDAQATPPPLRLIKISQAIFAGEVRPGDVVTVLARVLDPGDYVVPCLGQVWCRGEVRAAALTEVLYVEPEA